MFNIAIHVDDQLLMSGRRQSFSRHWSARLRAMGHDARVLHFEQPDFFQQLEECAGFMWWFAHLPFPRNLGRRLLPAIEHGMGIPVFPSWRTLWHFDDKVAQHYLLTAAGIPTPCTWIFWGRDAALRFCHEQATFPLVIKLSGGITSENVALLRDARQAVYWIGRMFRDGVTSLEQERGFSAATLKRRMKDAARLLIRGQGPATSARTDLQRGYVLFQEYLDGNAFDTRVTVIGNRAFAFRRFNRADDFRASGSGQIDWDPAQIDPQSVRLAFATARALQMQSCAVDVLKRSGQDRTINEISYYYEGWAVEKCPGHWRIDAHGEQLRWVEGHVAPQDAILDDFLDSLTGRTRRAPSPLADPVAAS